MTAFAIEREIDLPPEKAFSIISDFTRPPSPNIPIEVEKEGDLESHGVGTIRTITIGMVRVRERLESVNPPNFFTYTILSNILVQSGSSEIGILELEKSQIKTEIL